MIDENIPGFCPSPQLLAIQTISALVPASGQIVEVGSLFGRSAFAWASSCKDSVKVFCIDPWDSSEVDAYVGVSSKRGKYLGKKANSVQGFKSNIANRVSNIEIIQDRSPLREWKNGFANVIYLDGDHSYQAVCDDIEFWRQHLDADGILCGDDYNSDHDDVVQAVNTMAQKYAYQIFRMEKFWAYFNEQNLQTLRKAEAVFSSEWQKILA